MTSPARSAASSTTAGALSDRPTNRTMHSLSNVNAESMSADCAACGTGSTVRLMARGYVCSIRQAEYNARQAKRRKTEGAEERAVRNAYHAEYNRRYVYRLPKGGVEALLARAGGACEVCHTELTLATMCIDHDHACCGRADLANRACGQCIRGVLCKACNTGLGLFKDNPAILQEAIKYIAQRAA